MKEERRVAVVTGGGQGLGRAVAVVLDNAGFDVAVIGRTKSKLDDTVAMLKGKGLAVAADLTNGQQVRDAFAQIADRFGGVDVLINNAAVYNPFRLDEATDEQITAMISNTLTAPVFCLRLAIPLMRRRGGGDIVNISSQSVPMPQPFMTLYAAAKAGLENLSQGLRNELRGEHFRIIVFQVGVIADTTVDYNIWTPELSARVMEAYAHSGVGPFYVFPGASPESIAASIVHAVTLPRDISIERIEVRGAEM